MRPAAVVIVLAALTFALSGSACAGWEEIACKVRSPTVFTDCAEGDHSVVTLPLALDVAGRPVPLLKSFRTARLAYRRTSQRDSLEAAQFPTTWVVEVSQDHTLWTCARLASRWRTTPPTNCVHGVRAVTEFPSCLTAQGKPAWPGKRGQCPAGAGPIPRVLVKVWYESAPARYVGNTVFANHWEPVELQEYIDECLGGGSGCGYKK